MDTDFYSVYSVSSVDYLFHTDGHGGMSASERGGYCLSSELKRNLDGGSLADIHPPLPCETHRYRLRFR